MRSAILIGIVVCIVTLGGAYCISWYAQARATEEALRHVIAQVNEKQTLLTYDSIETSGFPSKVNVTISRPRFSGRIDLLLAQLAEEARKSGHPFHHDFPTAREWQQEAQLEGQIILGVNALSDNYTLQMAGNWVTSATVGGQQFSTTYMQEGGTFCSLQLERSAGLMDSFWNYETLLRDGEAFLRDFRLFDCAFPAAAVVDAGTNARLGGSGPARFYISNAPLLGEQHIRVYLTAPDMEITEAGDEVMERFVHALNPAQVYARKMALYGKQQVDIDFTYNGPSDFKNIPGPNFEISLGKFDITNAAYAVHMAFYASNQQVEGVNHAKLALRSESSFTPAYDALLRDLARALIQEAYTSADPRFMEFQAAMHQYTPEQLFAVITPVIPQFTSLGQMVQAIDLEYSGDPQFLNGEATLHDLEFSFSPYGLKGNGLAKRENGGQPTGHISLTCTNCASMIDDLMDYGARLRMAMAYFSQETAALPAPNPRLTQGIKDYLRSLSGPDKVNWRYEIVSHPQTGITVNGKPLNIVISRYYQYVAPALKPRRQR